MTATPTTYHVKHAAELWATDGPTGEHVEVLRGEIRDHGGNVLFSGTADECVAERATYRIACGCWPTEWRRLDHEISGADHRWNMVVES